MSLIVSIFDKKAKMWIKPYEALNEAVAIRGFVSSFRTSSTATMLKDYSEDYSLFIVGRFDEEDEEAPLYPFAQDGAKYPQLLLSGDEALAMADMLDRRDAERVAYKTGSDK